MSITVLLPENLYSAPLRALLEPLLPPGSVIRRPEDGMENLENRRLLFAVALDPSGCSLAYYGMLQALRGCDTLLRGSVAGVIVTGVGEFYTKDVARDMVFAANQAGCAFLGRPWWRPPAPCGISAPRPRSAAWTRKPPSAWRWGSWWTG